MDETPPGTSAPQFETPKSLNEKIGCHYEVLKLIASGGMGAVYKARHIELDRFVAIKILAPNLDGIGSETDFPFAQRFEQEARSMASLHHPNIVGVYDFGRTDDGILFFVMEFVEGRDLQEYLDSGELSEEQILSMPDRCAAPWPILTRWGWFIAM